MMIDIVVIGICLGLIGAAVVILVSVWIAIEGIARRK